MTLQPRLSFEDYLAAEREAVDEKHEFVAGRVLTRASVNYQHNLIAGHLLCHLANALKNDACVVLGSDMRQHIEAADACKYPDIMVLCEEPRFHDTRNDVLIKPTLLVEVLSPSTEAYDRGGKFTLYRNLPSLREYVLVARDRHSVEVFTRQDSNRWLLSAYEEPEQEAVFESLGCRIPLSDIYAKVRFEDSGEPI